MTYIPQYPILTSEDMLPKEHIRLISESELSEFDRAELNQLRNGVAEYNLVFSDTPENRERIAIKTSYFQIVAYKEGWRFDPQRYQVLFIDPRHSVLSREGEQTRILEFEKDAKLNGLSPEGRAGFVVSQEQVTRMKDEETDGLARRISNFFK